MNEDVKLKRVAGASTAVYDGGESMEISTCPASSSYPSRSTRWWHARCTIGALEAMLVCLDLETKAYGGSS